MKKNFQSIAAQLTPLADTMPVQRAPLAIVEPAIPAEPLEQFSFELRKSLRRQLHILAIEADTTMRAFVLSALREKGLAVVDSDLLDLRGRGVEKPARQGRGG
jgi:hypothetical protein